MLHGDCSMGGNNDSLLDQMSVCEMDPNLVPQPV